MSSDFENYVKELLAPLGRVRSKKMFGGAGIYINELFCALVIDDTLYFKGDDQNEDEFVAGGCPPFVYKHKDGRAVSVRYYRPPEEAMDNPMQMARWARLGLAAALRKSARAVAKAQRKQPARSKKPDSTKTE